MGNKKIKAEQAWDISKVLILLSQLLVVVCLFNTQLLLQIYRLILMKFPMKNYPTPTTGKK